MKLTIDLQTRDCELVTTDNTEISDSGNGYLPESSVLTPRNRYKYSDTVSVQVFTYNKVDSTKNEVYTEIYSHENTTQSNTFQHDGYVIYSYIVIPTKQWVNNNLANLSDYVAGVYYSDGVSLFKWNLDTQTEEEVTIQEILSVINLTDSTISRVDFDIVVICNLKNCYLHYCMNIINDKIVTCYSKDQNRDLLYKRDLVWMALNVIDFLAEKQAFMAAQELIERLFNCTGLCISKEILGNDCGCS